MNTLLHSGESVKSAEEDYLAPLNPEQLEAVLHSGHPLLILAGAGSGKTRVITAKIAYLIKERRIPPHAILAVTFTNKAAREMAERARDLEERASSVMIRTFHSFGAWFLRCNAERAGLEPNFTIYDEDDSLSLLSLAAENRERSELKPFVRRIARAKDYFLSPDDPDLSRIDYRKDFKTLYAAYEERLRRVGSVDFGDLIKRPVEILKEQPEVASRLRDRFHAVLVDEYQDANVAQFELLRALFGPETYLCVVGDDDQSIYRFRGAEVRNILEFPERFPGTDIIRLERNYRSVSPILHLASSVVCRNQGRLGKTLVAQREGGKQPVLSFLPDQEEEASFCARLIENSVRQSGARKASYADWAVLYRTNAQSLSFETAFLRRRIPYRVVGSLKFYEREEIKDALSLLSCMANPKDEVAFRRIINKPARGVGPAALRRIMEEADGTDGDTVAAAERALSNLPPKARAGVTVFLKSLAASAADLGGRRDAGPRQSDWAVKAGDGLSVCVARLLHNTGLAVYHAANDESGTNQRAGNLQELANAASLYPATFEGLAGFLEHIELDRSFEIAREEEDAARDAVTLITVHNTKGLEFPRVIMTGLEQGVFPRTDKRGEELEEERRLFYVGATRAMDELYLCTAARRRLYGRPAFMRPSLFLYEIEQGRMRIIGDRPECFGILPPEGFPALKDGLL
jgi:DNA helicase-2/ATP-dependent DNA helicase PcrA